MVGIILASDLNYEALLHQHLKNWSCNLWTIHIFKEKGIKMSLENIVKSNTEFETNFTKLSSYKSIIFISFAILIKTVTSKFHIDCSKTSMHYRGYILPNFVVKRERKE